MSAHVHYDVADIERRLRAMAAASLAQCRANAETSEDRQFVDVQELLSDLTTIAAIGCVKAENNGADRELIGRALAIQVATIEAQFISSCKKTDPLACIAYVMQRRSVLDMLLNGSAPPDGVIVSNDAARPMQGGRA